MTTTTLPYLFRCACCHHEHGRALRSGEHCVDCRGHRATPATIHVGHRQLAGSIDGS